MDVEDPL